MKSILIAFTGTVMLMSSIVPHGILLVKNTIAKGLDIAKSKTIKRK